MIEVAIGWLAALVFFGAIIGAVYLFSYILAHRFPVREDRNFQVTLPQMLAGTLTLAATLTWVFHTRLQGEPNSDTVLFILVLVGALQGFAFLIAADVLRYAKKPVPQSACAAGIAVFMVLFLFFFIIAIPTWMRWRSLFARGMGPD